MPNEHRNREEWLRDVEARQRNVVFPDTVNNERRFWQNFVSGNRKLTGVQVAGIGILYAALVGTVIIVLSLDFRTQGDYNSVWKRVVGQFGGYVLGLAVVGCFLLLIRFATGKKSN